jgi:hypothetical protein
MKDFVICVDFDGTIVDHRYPAIGKPVPDAIDWLIRLQRKGAKLVLWTMRSGDRLEQAVDYLENQGVTLHGVNQNPDQKSWTSSPKAYGHVYVDDAAFGCPMLAIPGFSRRCVDWSRVGPTLDQRVVQHVAGG